MSKDTISAEHLLATYGARYWEPGAQDVHEAKPDELYYYECFIGEHSIEIARGDSVFWLSSYGKALATVGTDSVGSTRFAVKIRGYQAPNRSCHIAGHPHLPYVNGCSTKQLLPPLRAGDPTMQYLAIPPYSAEQAHHIHSTVRAVYVLEGRGVSVVGMEGKAVSTELLPGMVAILDPMCPHHFETPQGQWLYVIPVHVWSSTPSEHAHPMFFGTHLMNQGE